MPFKIYHAKLSGKANLNLEKGRLLEVNSSGAKLLDVLSLQSLFRFATLDLKGSLGNIVTKGTPFNSISSNFSINNGIAQTKQFDMNLDQARVALPSDLERATKILREQDRLIEEARGSADALVAQAREEVSSMVAQTEIVAAARKEAKKIIDDVNDESEAQQDEIDAYVDSRLATLEVILNKTLETISKGRDRLAGVDAKSALTELNDKK